MIAGELNWHIACLSKDLKKRPLRVIINGTPIVIFRTRSGKLCALEDRCIHRGIKLSTGKVCDDFLVCPFHGWKYSADRRVYNSENTEVQLDHNEYQVEEHSNAIWIKEGPDDGVNVETSLGIKSDQVSISQYQANVPLELAIDIFLEPEHTATAHAVFGFDGDRLNEVTCEHKLEESRIVSNIVGPPRPLPPFIRNLMGFSRSDLFGDEILFSASPLYIKYEHFRIRPGTDSNRHLCTFRIFFSPNGNGTTTIYVMFCFKDMPLVKYKVARWAATQIANKIVALEMRMDMKMLNSLACLDPKGKLADDAVQKGVANRFDYAILQHRNLLKEYYYVEGSP